MAGIGFTVSLFITGLAFDDTATQDDAKIGILVASIISAAAGALVFAVTSRKTAAKAARFEPARDPDPASVRGT